MKFIDILNHYKDNIYGGGRSEIYDHYNASYTQQKRFYFVPKDRSFGSMELDFNRSLNDLLSVESGFLQAMFGEEWCHLYNSDYYKDNNNNEFEEVYDLVRGMRSLPRWKYHAMRLSILSQEEKIKYLEDNIIVE